MKRKCVMRMVCLTMQLKEGRNWTKCGYTYAHMYICVYICTYAYICIYIYSHINKISLFGLRCLLHVKKECIMLILCINICTPIYVSTKASPFKAHNLYAFAPLEVVSPKICLAYQPGNITYPLNRSNIKVKAHKTWLIQASQHHLIYCMPSVSRKSIDSAVVTTCWRLA